MSPFAIVLLVAALALLAAAEWGRVEKLRDGRTKRERARRKSKFRVVEHPDDDFARSVERDLAALPTIDEHDLRKH
ncbi:MAG TPA: hypothetical protein VFB42_06925 [Gaiellaceae bacterium]|nr:hypothetical protein [Gaiellaceae bacterium]